MLHPNVEYISWVAELANRGKRYASRMIRLPYGYSK